MRGFQLLMVSTLAVALAQPALAQSKIDQKGQGGSSVDGDISAQVIDDAGRLCELAVDNDRQILDALLSEGWEQEVTYDIGNAPFYKEIFATVTYEGVGEAELWGFLEEYPDHWIGYCSVTIIEPALSISLAPINDRFDLVGSIELDGPSVFGSWRDTRDQPSTFIHSYTTPEEFVYQVTKLTDLTETP